MSEVSNQKYYSLFVFRSSLFTDFMDCKITIFSLKNQVFSLYFGMYKSGELDREIGENQLGVTIAFYVVDGIFSITLDFLYVVMMYKRSKILYLEIGLEFHIHETISPIIGQESLSEYLHTIFEKELLGFPTLLGNLLTPRKQMGEYPFVPSGTVSHTYPLDKPFFKDTIVIFSYKRECLAVITLRA